MELNLPKVMNAWIVTKICIEEGKAIRIFFNFNVHLVKVIVSTLANRKMDASLNVLHIVYKMYFCGFEAVSLVK